MLQNSEWTVHVIVLRQKMLQCQSDIDVWVAPLCWLIWVLIHTSLHTISGGVGMHTDIYCTGECNMHQKSNILHFSEWISS
jgi:hypothetical protein